MSERDRKRVSILECVDHAAYRAAAAYDQDLRRGLCWLASIASTSFMVGLVGTMGQMMTRMFYGCDGNWVSCVAPIGGIISFALSFGAVGLLLSCVSFCGYRYLTTQVESLRVEMGAARLQLLNDLSRLLSRTE